MHRRIAMSCAAVALLTSCGTDNSYGAAEVALRDWLRLVEDRDHESACRMLTSGYRKELSVTAGATPTRSSCATALDGLVDGSDRVPPADSAMAVPVWDPSGEALIEVTDPTNGTGFKYWMLLENREWLVAGQAS